MAGEVRQELKPDLYLSPIPNLFQAKWQGKSVRN